MGITIKRRIINCLIVSLFLVSFPLLISSSASANWVPSATLTWGPDETVYHQETADFTYNLQIDSIKRTSSIQISSIGDWFNTTLRWFQNLTAGTRPALQLSIAGSPSAGPAALNVHFTSTVSGGTPQYSYSWTFGDGQTASQANPTHTYASAGSFTATLTVQDAHGRTAQDKFNITVYDPMRITASSDVTSGTSPLTVHFTCSVTGGSPAYSYLWSFGDDSTSSEANPIHQYNKAGTFNVSLVVTDSQSRQQTYHTTITVSALEEFDSTAASGGPLFLGMITAIVGLTAVTVFLLERKRRTRR